MVRDARLNYLGSIGLSKVKKDWFWESLTRPKSRISWKWKAFGLSQNEIEKLSDQNQAERSLWATLFLEIKVEIAPRPPQTPNAYFSLVFYRKLISYGWIILQWERVALSLGRCRESLQAHNTVHCWRCRQAMHSSSDHIVTQAETRSTSYRNSR